MKLSDIYNAILAKVNTLTGETYILDRDPQKNFSEDRSGVYRFLRPTAIEKERRTQMTPETRITVQVGIIRLSDKAADMTAAEDELDALVNALLRTAQIGENLIVYAASTEPASGQYIETEALDSEVPFIQATANLAIRGYY